MLVGLAVLALSGLVVGWRIHTGAGEAIAGFALLGLFAMAMLWLGTAIGVSVRSPDAVQGIAFLFVFPLTFISNAFVPTAGLPSVLQTIAEWNPVSALVAATRTLFGNPVATPADAPWPLEHPVLAAVAWSLAILAVCMPLAMSRYKARTTD
jgi:ABC-type multidrug transport system permease subunit